MMSNSVVIACALAQKPKIAGHTWVLLQYLLGFRRPGWKTLLVDHLEYSIRVDEVGRNCALKGSADRCRTVRFLDYRGAGRAIKS
jgi:hypothetical protein